MSRTLLMLSALFCFSSVSAEETLRMALSIDRSPSFATLPDEITSFVFVNGSAIEDAGKDNCQLALEFGSFCRLTLNSDIYLMKHAQIKPETYELASFDILETNGLYGVELKFAPNLYIESVECWSEIQMDAESILHHLPFDTEVTALPPKEEIPDIGTLVMSLSENRSTSLQDFMESRRSARMGDWDSRDRLGRSSSLILSEHQVGGWAIRFRILGDQ